MESGVQIERNRKMLVKQTPSRVPDSYDESYEFPPSLENPETSDQPNSQALQYVYEAGTAVAVGLLLLSGVVPAMAPVKPFFACLLTVAALPHLKAWAPTDSNCHRLVPLQITSVVTPCVYPCLLLSPYNGYGDIVLRKEVDGTPCK
ncbi:hypothetical protein MTO96_033794, partial [Rhipicephalus appendiculatus]